MRYRKRGASVRCPATHLRCIPSCRSPQPQPWRQQSSTQSPSTFRIRNGVRLLGLLAAGALFFLCSKCRSADLRFPSGASMLRIILRFCNRRRRSRRNASEGFVVPKSPSNVCEKKGEAAGLAQSFQVRARNLTLNALRADLPRCTSGARMTYMLLTMLKLITNAAERERAVEGSAAIV